MPWMKSTAVRLATGGIQKEDAAASGSLELTRRPHPLPDERRRESNILQSADVDTLTLLVCVWRQRDAPAINIVSSSRNAMSTAIRERHGCYIIAILP